LAQVSYLGYISILLVDLVLDISLSIYSSVMIIDKKQRICFFL